MELRYLVHDFNKKRPTDALPISVSDIVTAVLDFVLEHRLDLSGLENPEQVREVVAAEVYRKAYLRFIQLHELS